MKITLVILCTFLSMMMRTLIGLNCPDANEVVVDLAFDISTVDSEDYSLRWVLGSYSGYVYNDSFSWPGYDSSQVDSYYFSFCMANDDCYSLGFSNAYCNGAWGCEWEVYYQILVNNQSITFGKQLTTLTGDMEMDFCVSYWNMDTSSSVAKANVTIEIDFDSSVSEFDLEIWNVTGTSSTSIYSTIIVSDGVSSNDDGFDGILTNLMLESGECIEFVFSDELLTETYSNNIYMSRGTYKIFMDNELAAVGGYYDTSESNVICNNPNDILFCTFSPGKCTNGSIIDITSQEKSNSWSDSVVALSYNTFENCELTDGSSYSSINCFGGSSCQDCITENVNCFGAFSCVNLIHEQATLATCYGMGSCIGSIQRRGTGGDSVQCYGVQSCFKNTIIEGNWFREGISTMNALFVGSFVAINTIINITNIMAYIEIGGYYSLYNTHFICNDTSYGCDIYCLDNTLAQFTVELQCGCKVWNCTFTSTDNQTNTYNSINYIVDIDDEAYINGSNINSNNRTNVNVSQILNEMIELSTKMGSKMECNETYDIGYPMYVETTLSSFETGVDVCCRGYQSCAMTSSIYTDLGNIWCTGYQSCTGCDLIWNGESFSESYTQTSDGTTTELGNIHCIAYQSCAASVIESVNNVYCASYYACQNAAMLKADNLYCTMNACGNSLIKNAKNIYLIDNQASDVMIYSGIRSTDTDDNEMNLYFVGIDSGKDVTFYCNNGDICNIICNDFKSCNDETTQLHCYGKCSVDCPFDSEYCPLMVTSRSPTVSPTAAPTNSPTDVPTSDTLTLSSISEEDLTKWLNWTLAGVFVFTVILIIIAIIDARLVHKSELLKSMSLLVVAFYTSDFISDLFFCAKLYIDTMYYKENGDKISDSRSGILGDYFLVHLVLLCLCLGFIIIPLLVNMIQLHMEISKWAADSVLSRTTEVRIWIKKHLRHVYLVAFICGSSFSAIKLCNCYLFQQDLFAMGLPRYYQNKFRNKRFFSIVLLENLPQIIIQICSLSMVFVIQEDLQSDDNGSSFDVSSVMITMFSMFFTVISILLSLFEYIGMSKFVRRQSIVALELDVESQDIANMNGLKFRQNLVFLHHWSSVHAIAKVLQINDAKIQRLKPLHVSKGVRMVYFIEYNDATKQEKTQYLKDIKRKIMSKIKDETLINDFRSAFKVPIGTIRSVKASFVIEFDNRTSNRKSQPEKKQTEMAASIIVNGLEANTRTTTNYKE